MNVIDITERLFTKQESDELCSLLRRLATITEPSDDDIDIRERANFLMRKAGGANKFFRNQSTLLKEILY